MAGLPPIDSFEAVAREWHDKNVPTGLHRLCAPGRGQRQRMVHIGGGEDIGTLAAEQAVAQQARGAEHERHLLAARRGLEVGADARQRRTQAAGGIDGDGRLGQRRLRAGSRHRPCKYRARPAPHCFELALGKNSCSPSIL